MASGAIHICDGCRKSGTWSEGWEQWGTLDECVFKTCSDGCREFIKPSTDLIGKPRSYGYGGRYFSTDDLNRARADLARRRDARGDSA
jgi:hypothetical protein